MSYGTTTAPHLERAKTGAYDFQFGEYINGAFKTVTKNIGPFIGFAALFFLISFVVGLIPFIGTLIGSFVITPCLVAGLYYAADKSYNNQPFEFGLFFKGFDKLGDLALMTLLQTLLYLAAAIPLIIAVFAGAVSVNSGGYDGVGVGMIVLGLICLLPLIYLAISYIFAPLFIIFYDMDPWPAMETSRKIVTAKFFSFFLLMIVVGFIAFAGVLALGVGVLFTFPLALCIGYVAFHHIVGMPYADREFDTMSHLVD